MDPDNVLKEEKLGRLSSHFHGEPSPPSPPNPVLALSTLRELAPAWLGSSAAGLGGCPPMEMKEKMQRPRKLQADELGPKTSSGEALAFGAT